MTTPRYDPSNPVVCMSGITRRDIYSRMSSGILKIFIDIHNDNGLKDFSWLVDIFVFSFLKGFPKK